MFLRILRRRCGDAGGALSGADSVCGVAGGGEGRIGVDILSNRISVTLHMKITKHTYFFLNVITINNI